MYGSSDAAQRVRLQDIARDAQITLRVIGIVSAVSASTSRIERGPHRPLHRRGVRALRLLIASALAGRDVQVGPRT